MLYRSATRDLTAKLPFFRSALPPLGPVEAYIFQLYFHTRYLNKVISEEVMVFLKFNSLEKKLCFLYMYRKKIPGSLGVG